MSFLVTKIFWCLVIALLIGLVVGWLLRRYSALAREMELQGEIDLREERMGDLKVQVSDRDEKLHALGTDLQHWRDKVPGLEATLAERDDQVMSLTMDLDGWKQKLPGLERRLADTESARGQLSADLAASVAAVSEKERALAESAEALEAMRLRASADSERFSSELAQANSELTANKQQLDGVRGELEAAASEAARKAEQASALETQLTEQQAAAATLQKDALERERAIEELRESLKNQDAERTSLAEQVTALGPVAARVDSQDASIVSLNKDLRARDTTIKGLNEALAAKEAERAELLAGQRSLDVLRDEMDGVRQELAGANQRLAMVDAQSTQSAQDIAKEKARSAGIDREWRARLRIAESARQNAQAELYRRQESIDRLTRQIAGLTPGAETSPAYQSLLGSAASASAASVAARSAASVAATSSAAASAGEESASVDADAGDARAGRVASADDREWRARVQIAESARRRAEADSLRQGEQVARLERVLRELQDAPPPGASTALTRSVYSPAPTLSKPQEASVSEGQASGAQRFLAAAPQSVDDLREIKGVGKVLEKTLNSLGIYQFAQIARFTADDIAWVDDRLKFKGRITRDEWVEQAKELHQTKYGSDPQV